MVTKLLVSLHQHFTQITPFIHVHKKTITSIASMEMAKECKMQTLMMMVVMTTHDGDGFGDSNDNNFVDDDCYDNGAHGDDSYVL